MKTIDDFLKQYRMQEFYDWQKKQTEHPFTPFIQGSHNYLLHGIIPGFSKNNSFFLPGGQYHIKKTIVC